ncbi:hypothetical protein [Halapricum desulfuricans]|uniref:Uncharacterized protein n=1 Tax=Halapricum desulfuricans TaxID=2841257 RepID=A0A897N5K1_9EURY|nr:hypothetical protein [Halapricum desulfuricans]QSG07997.1 hypothetical protein HSR122_0590 [Halapricum desulfuricans]
MISRQRLHERLLLPGMASGAVRRNLVLLLIYLFVVSLGVALILVAL